MRVYESSCRSSNILPTHLGFTEIGISLLLAYKYSLLLPPCKRNPWWSVKIYGMGLLFVSITTSHYPSWESFKNIYYNANFSVKAIDLYHNVLFNCAIKDVMAVFVIIIPQIIITWAESLSLRIVLVALTNMVRPTQEWKASSVGNPF